MTRKRNVILASVGLLAAVGLGTGAAVAASGAPGQPGMVTSPTASGTAASPVTYSAPGYSWYQSMMSGYYGGGTGMMGGSSYGWMMSQAGYEWMTGSTDMPGWMRGGSLPGSMMSGAVRADPGTTMGTLFASAPGPRVSPAQAQRLGDQVPAGASIDQADRTITFTTMNVRIAVLASPSMPAESFRLAGMTDPTVSVPAGAHVTMQLVNADADMAHGLVIMPAGTSSSAMPMMTGAPSFTGAALWFLGKPTAAGMHTGTLAFTAAVPGSYQYLCPVPSHARDGMAATFTVR
jgi:uncharacterized cupredoxin-like copper-binding protein